MPNHCPEALRWAVMHFAESVRQVKKLEETPELNCLCEYHVLEYLPGMEQMLVEQVLTSFPTDEEREAVLSSANLDYLIQQMRLTEKAWEEA